jgi:8-oxo-dGTP diphosphatase
LKQFNIGIKGVIIEGDKVLILRSVKGYWEVPGGRMEDGEDIHDTLIRELGEELLNVQNIKIHETLSAFKINKEYIPNTALMLIFFRVTADFDGDPKISDEHSEYRWSTTEEALQLVEAASQQAISRAFQV